MATSSDISCGHAELAQVKHVIDCDADPLIPYDGWKVEEHRKGDQFTWNPKAVKLHLSANQMAEQCIEGNKLRKELAKEPVLNANILDYLIRHPHLIPEEWKVDENGNTRYNYFWGTIYRDDGDGLCVPCLCFESGHWRWSCKWLDNDWHSRSPAAVLVS